MHQTHYESCLRCKKRYEVWELRRMISSVMKCPDANKWRKVIDDVLPHVKDSDDAKKANNVLNAMGIVSTSWHRYYHELGNDDIVISVRIVEDALEELMRHVPFNGALHHNEEYVCGPCVAEMRKELYDGGTQVPGIKCPRCSAVLVPASQE